MTVIASASVNAPIVRTKSGGHATKDLFMRNPNLIDRSFFYTVSFVSLLSATKMQALLIYIPENEMVLDSHAQPRKQPQGL